MTSHLRRVISENVKNLADRGDAVTKEAVWNAISGKSLSELGFTANDVLALSGFFEGDLVELAHQPSLDTPGPTVEIRASRNAALLESWTKSVKQTEEGISFQSLANLVNNLDKVLAN